MGMLEPPPVVWVIRRASGDQTLSPPPAESWSLALDELSANRLLPLAHQLLGPDAATLHPETRLVLGAATALARRQVNRRRAQLAELAPALTSAGVIWLVLKGYPLAHRLYADPALRPSGDADILVGREQVAEAGSLLEALGYRGDGSFDWSFHHRRYARAGADEVDIVELHWGTDPPGYSAPDPGAVLAARVPFHCEGIEAWIPSPDYEPDLLIRHLARHGGGQAILLVDLLRHQAGGGCTHPLGVLVGDELERLGLPRLVDGPPRLRLLPLRRWMRRRTYRERRQTRPIVVPELCLALALSRSPLGLVQVLRRHVWPAEPPPRWQALAASPEGRNRWRWRRLARFGRDEPLT